MYVCVYRHVLIYSKDAIIFVLQFSVTHQEPIHSLKEEVNGKIL